MLWTDKWVFILLILVLTFQGVIAQTKQAPAAPAKQAPVAQNKQAAGAPTKHHRKSHKALSKVAPSPVLPPMPRGPLPQLPLDLLPPAPPKVSYQNGMLSIVAQNSTLGDILRDVRKLTGASIDVPPNAAERVVTRLGPGAPRDVLASLLNGSAFNYVMVGSSSNPAGVASVVLTAKTVAGATPTPTPTPGNPYQPAQPIYTPQAVVPVPQPVVAPVVPQPVVAESDDNASTDEQDAADENADQVQTETQQPDANGAVQQEQQQLPQGQPLQAQPQQPNAGPKTPEQILEMLRQQQQQQQQQQVQPPSPQPPDN